MLNLPYLLIMPLFGGAAAGTLEWPALGALLAWFFVLSLLGASAGLIRSRHRTPSAPPQSRCSAPREPEIPLPHVHREAA